MRLIMATRSSPRARPRAKNAVNPASPAVRPQEGYARSPTSVTPQEPLVGRTLTALLGAVAHRFGRLPAEGGPRGEALLAVVQTFAAIAVFLDVWATAEGRELARLALLFAEAAHRLRSTPPGRVVPAEVDTDLLAERLDQRGATIVVLGEEKPGSKGPLLWGPLTHWNGRQRIVFAPWHPDVRVMAERLSLAVNRPLHADEMERLGMAVPPAGLTKADVDDLAVTIDDIITAAEDQLAPLSRRRLGRAEAREHVASAAAKARAIIASANPEVGHA
jgi:hypothetical protein